MIVKQTSCICCLSAACAGTVCCARKGHTFSAWYRGACRDHSVFFGNGGGCV